MADVPDPDNFLRVCIQQERWDWQNETYELLIEKARRSTDQAERITLYRQADKILIEAGAIMPLTYGRWDTLVKPWMKQYICLPGRRSVFWKDVIIEPHEFNTLKSEQKLSIF